MPPALNADWTSKVEENQFHILEALDIIQQKLDASSSPDSSSPINITSSKDLNSVISASEKRLTSHITKLQDKLSESDEELRKTYQITQSLNELTNKEMHEIMKRLGDLETKLDSLLSATPNGKSTSNPNGDQSHAVYYALYIFAGLSGLAAVIFAYTNYVKAQQGMTKKFL